MILRRQPSNKLERCPWLRMSAAGQRVASSDSVHTARYNFSLCNCQLLGLEFRTISILPHKWRRCTSKWHLWFGFLQAKDFLWSKWLPPPRLVLFWRDTAKACQTDLLQFACYSATGRSPSTVSTRNFWTVRLHMYGLPLLVLCSLRGPL